MNSDQIANLANLDGVAADLDLQLILRAQVLPEFLADVGDARWRRTNTTLALVVGTQKYNLPDDFYKMIEVAIPNAGQAYLQDADKLTYIGEDQNLVNKAEKNTVQYKPCGYYFVPREPNSTLSTYDPSHRAIRFDCPSDQAYTAYLVYVRGAYFADFQQQTDMNKWVPEMLQSGLVAGLRREIIDSRYGQGDSRWERADAKYQRCVVRARESKDHSTRNYAVYLS